MRILIENGGYGLVNHGDTAMLQVAVQRLRALWPDATIDVLTANPQALIRYCPTATPCVIAKRAWLKQSLKIRAYPRIPSMLLQIHEEVEQRVWQYIPVLGSYRANWNELLNRDMVQAIRQADLLVASGGGYLTDSFETFALMALDTFEIAARRGKPTAMFGQGLGPLGTQAVRIKARKVLPMVDLIALREQRAAIPLLQQLGIAPKRLRITGDDAITLAYNQRAVHLGNAIGINLRVSWYSEVNPHTLLAIRQILDSIAKRYMARLLPVPIAMAGAYGRRTAQSDPTSIHQILGELDPSGNGGMYLDSPDMVISEIGRCRLIITGSYHSAIFALSQGIPVIALVQSAYYTDKFLGIIDQFGVGCKLIFLNDPQLQTLLTEAVDELWHAAPRLRQHLLNAAHRQVLVSEAAYQELYRLVEGRQPVQKAHDIAAMVKEEI